MTTHTLCFRSLMKKLQTFEILSGLREERFPKWRTSREQLADVLLLMLD